MKHMHTPWPSKSLPSSILPLQLSITPLQMFETPRRNTALASYLITSYHPFSSTLFNPYTSPLLQYASTGLTSMLLLFPVHPPHLLLVFFPYHRFSSLIGTSRL